MSSADDITGAPPPAPARPRRHWVLRVLAWAVGVVIVLLVLVAAAAAFLDTAPGRRFVATRVAALDMSGVHIRVGRIDGSIYGRMTLRDVVVTDQKGVVATSPAIVLDWAPGALLDRHVLVNEAASTLIDLRRQPVLKASTGKSNMPSLSYTVKRLVVSTLVLEPALTRERRAASIQASAEMAGGRTRLQAEAHTLALPGSPAAGDVALVNLEAEPKANRLNLAAHVFGPKDGVLDRLLKLDAPVALDVGGRGDWRNWRGHALASLGGASVLDAALSAQSGRFGAAGTARPGVVMKSLAHLTSPAVRFDVTASMTGARIALTGHAASDQFDAQVAGAVDRDKQLLDHVQVAARLLDPSALSAQLNGRDVRLAFTADGPFARPLVDYDFTAQSLGYGKISAQDVAAHGRSARAADGTVQIPVSLTARRLTGVSATTPPLTAIALSGPVVIHANGAVAADLQLRSAQLAAALVLRGSQRSATYAGTLRAQLTAQAVQQLGLGSIVGGATTLDTSFASSRPTPLQVSALRLTSPQLTITQAQAAYGAGGRISLSAALVSAQYGAAQITAGGTVSAIRAHVSAPNPKLPIPVTKLEADLIPAPGGAYQLAATGVSPSGPLTLQAVVQVRAPLTITLNKAQFAGLTLAGTVTRSAAGPFTGGLTVAGDGLSGGLQLGAAGAVQTAQLDLRANDARLPLTSPLLIRSGSIEGSVALNPGAPVVSARASLADIQQGQLTLTSLRTAVDYRSGVGRASFALAGNTGTTFALAGRASLVNDLVRLNAQGEIGHERLRLAAPAEIARQGGVWRLAPMTILSPDGQLVLAGQYGGGASLTAQLQNVDLALINAIRPDVGVSGRMSGEANVAMPQGGAPTGRLALQITGLTHTGASSVSIPVDVNAIGALTADGAQASAAIHQRGAVVGRLQVSANLPAAGSYSQRLGAATVTGGVRYNGPADALVSMAGMAGQQLTGQIAIGADISGALEHPQLRGVVLGKGLDYENAKYGTHITGIVLNGRFTGSRLELVSLAGSTRGDGSITASGYADLSAAQGWPIKLDMQLHNAQLAQSDTLGAKLSGSLAITNSRPEGGLVTGDLRLDTARYEVSHVASGETAELKGVRWKGQPLTPIEAPSTTGPPSRWRLNIKIHAPNQILVSGMGLNSEWRADLTVVGDTSRPRIVGDVRSVRGTYSFGGRQLTLGDSDIHFDGSEPANPVLDITASATVNSVTATINVTGTAQRPEIAFSSSPALPEDEVLSQLLFGGPSAQLNSIQALQLAASLNSLRGGAGGLGVLGKLSRATGLENLQIQAPNAQTGQGVSVGAGRYITNSVYVDVLTDARGYTATQIEVALTRSLSLLSQISTFGATSGSIRYTHRY